VQIGSVVYRSRFGDGRCGSASGESRQTGTGSRASTSFRCAQADSGRGRGRYVEHSSESGLTGWVINDKRAIHAENQLSVMATSVFSGTFNVGVGAWYAIPVVQHGFIPSLNNSFDVEFGGFFQYYKQPQLWSI